MNAGFHELRNNCVTLAFLEKCLINLHADFCPGLHNKCNIYKFLEHNCLINIHLYVDFESANFDASREGPSSEINTFC